MSVKKDVAFQRSCRKWSDGNPNVGLCPTIYSFHQTSPQKQKTFKGIHDNESNGFPRLGYIFSYCSHKVVKYKQPFKNDALFGCRLFRTNCAPLCPGILSLCQLKTK
jgi:hypothetical protein